jgi:antagonist of KipI
MAELLIVRAGMLTTVQDAGRWGYQSSGVAVAGPMDPCAHRLANALVGNDAGAAALEITLIGPELAFEDARTFAIAGADFEATLDGAPVPLHAPVAAAAGSRLRVGARRRGTRAAIAIAGGIETPPVLGSRATHLLSGMGGFEGRALRAGDRLALGDPRSITQAAASLRVASAQAAGVIRLPDPGGSPATIRVLPGPQADLFAPQALAILQAAPYAVADQSNRMGFRLQGAALPHRNGADIISDATPLGVLQVPASGQPILLMADRQTTGGYPKIATVIAADIGLAGQLGPGDRLRFVVCSPREAMAALIAQERAMMTVEGATRKTRP